MDMFGQQEDRYISLSNKYRPQTFEDMVGQETISKTLTNAIKLGRIGHAYLFYGPRGCGKTTSARIFAKALNCTGNGDAPTPTPCGKCPQCIEIANGSDMDVLELDAASNTQVEKIREAIIDTVSLAAGRDRFKVFILDEVHMLSDSSFNALLKTIEEPPSHVVFILATTEKHKVPATISSRCQTFRFRPITQEDISSHIKNLAAKENLEIEDKAISIIAKQAGGALRDALTLLDRAIAYSDGKIDEAVVSQMLGLMPEDLLKNCTQALFSKDYNAMHDVFETIQKEGFDPLSFLRDLKNALGDIFYLAIGHGSEPFAGAAELAKTGSPSFIAALTRKLNRIVEETKFSDTPIITAEVGLFTVMDSAIDMDAFIARLENLEKALAGSANSFPAEKKTLNEAAPLKIAPQPEINTSFKAEKKPAPAEQFTPPTSFSEPKIKPAPAVTQAAVRAIRKEEPSLKTPEDKELWQLFKTSFKNNFFIFDALNNALPVMEEAQWRLSFNSANTFYATALEAKIVELEQRVKTLTGKDIKISFNGEAPEPTAKTEVKKTAPAKKKDDFKPTFNVDEAIKEVRTKQKKQIQEDNSIISAEEPFIKADFSQEFEIKESAKTDREIPQHIKDFLSIIPGEVIS